MTHNCKTGRQSRIFIQSKLLHNNLQTCSFKFPRKDDIIEKVYKATAMLFSVELKSSLSHRYLKMMLQTIQLIDCCSSSKVGHRIILFSIYNMQFIILFRTHKKDYLAGQFLSQLWLFPNVIHSILKIKLQQLGKAVLYVFQQLEVRMPPDSSFISKHHKWYKNLWLFLLKVWKVNWLYLYNLCRNHFIFIIL